VTTFQDLITMFEEEHGKLPKHKIVCPTCDGDGTHVNPAVDGNGISPDQFREDPDFEEAYFSGVYDVRCEECEGKNVVEVIDEDLLEKNEELASEWFDWVESWAEDRAVRAQERAMGA
jgi:predicted methyltransferase